MATDFFKDDVPVVEVAPMRSFQRYVLLNKSGGYVSFDLDRFAMERGDITKMRFANDSLEYFLASHVLEHVPAEGAALREIHRVLRPGGVAILQVPLDQSVEYSYEYSQPDPREVNHVRRYGRDFPAIIARYCFNVRPVSVQDLVAPELIRRHGLNREPFYFAQKPSR